MGGSSSKKDSSFRANDWQTSNEPQLMPEDQSYSVVRNRVSGEMLDRYLLQFPNQQQYNKYMESVQYRRNEGNIVRIVHYEPKIVKQFCGSAYMLNVYLQHCKSRLSEYKDIPFPDYLYCAMAMLDGYKKLYSKIGKFGVSEQQVMIDQEGEVRVWLNQDFSSNQAQADNLPSHGRVLNDGEYEMVQDIMNMVFDNSDESEGPAIRLKDFYERELQNNNSRVGFEQAKNIVAEYSRVNNIEIPNLFKSVYEIYQNYGENSNHNHNQILGNDEQLQDDTLNLNSQNRRNFVGVSPMPHDIPQVQGNIYPGSYIKDTSRNLLPPINHHLPQQVVHHGGVPLPIQNRPYAPQIIHNPNTNSGIIRIPPPQRYNQAQNAPFHIPPQPYPQIRHNFNHIPGQILHRPAPNPNFIHAPQPMRPIFNQPPIMQMPPVNIPVLQQQQRPLQTLQNLSQPIDKNIELGEEELEIQKKIILKDSANHDEYAINEAKIIRDLSDLHKIQQQERSKRSERDQDSSRNVSPNRLQQGDEYDDHYEAIPHKTGNKQNQNHYYFEEGHEMLNGNQNNQNIQINQRGRSNRNIEQQQQNQYYNTFNTNTIQKTATLTQNQNQNYAPYQQNGRKRQFYYTLGNEVEIDPQIAADMAAFIKA